MEQYELIIPSAALAETGETLQLPSPDLLREYQLMADRILYLDDDMEAYCLEIVKQIQLWNLEDRGKPVEERKPIKLLIFTDGGDLHYTWSLIATIEQSVTPVWTINMGLACSAGALVLMAGSKRFCVRRSLALIHSGSGQVGGTYEQTEANMAMYKEMVASMSDFVLEHSAIDPKVFKKRKASEWYLNDQDQLKYGVVDQMVTSIEEIL